MIYFENILELLREENIGKVCVVDKESNPWYIIEELGKTYYIIHKNGHGQIALYDIKNYDSEMELYGESVLVDSSYIMVLEFNIMSKILESGVNNPS